MAALDSLLSTAQNVATAINALAQTYLNVQGAQTASAISTATQLKSGAGRVCSVSVITAGAAVGAIYDTTDTTSTAHQLYVIPRTVAVFVVNLPASYGIVVAPGSGQVVTVSFS